MKKRKNRLVLVPIIGVLLLAYLLWIKPTIDQNRTVRGYFNMVLTAVQKKDKERINAFYTPSTLPDAYLDQLFTFQLLGWEIKKVGGQPWPMQTGNEDNYVLIDLYYQLPDTTKETEAKYQTICHPVYGKCIRYIARLGFYYDETNSVKWWLTEPDMKTGKNMMIPWQPEAK